MSFQFPSFRPAVVALPFLGSVAVAAPVKFNRDVRPMLSDTCFHCHGFDKSSRKGGLRLDLAEESQKPAKSGAIPIVPGKPEESEVMKRILSTDKDEIMPPPEAHKVLKPEQVEIFRRWIAEGAVYEPHWAYTPLEQPSVPEPTAKDSAAVDAYIAAGLKEQGLSMSAPADRATLLRRVTLDLTGLPPSPEEVAAFVADQSPEAFAKVVDRLLASPHFGERWAVWWLDLARFSDTVGYHGDQNNRSFPYRDYVVAAFNANKSFADFTREQLAGDLMPNATPEQLTATGFNRLNMMTREGGAQPGEYLAKYGAERTRTVSNAFLGSTFGCAECHDHKFDPISAKDFYSLQAFFADVKQWGVYGDYHYTPNPDLKGFNNDSPFPPEIEVANPYLQQRMAKLDQEMAAVAKAVLQATPPLAQAYADWKSDGTRLGWESKGAVLTSNKVVPTKERGKKPVEPSGFKPVLKAGDVVEYAETKADDTVLEFTPERGRVAAIRLEALLGADGKSIFRGGQLTGNVNLQVKQDGKPLTIFHAQASDWQPSYVGGQDVIGVQGGWKIGHGEKNHSAVYVLERPITLRPDETLQIELPGNMLAAFRVSLAAMVPQEAGVLSTWQEDSPIVFFTSTLADKPTLKRLQQLQREYLQCRGGKAWTMVTEAVAKPLPVRVLPRGNWMDTTGPEVEPAVPHFLPGHPEAGKRRLNRLDLADWLLSKANPLTARATVNRVWKQLFGAGLSANLDDLGFQGDTPSHPELLDWLAAGFRDGGWDFKALVRRVVLSQAYQQSSSLRSDVLQKDPNNRWLASQNPRRLDAEFVRDNALTIAGLLQPDLGGPSVRPYQPADYYAAIQFPNRDYAAETDSRQWRRGLYMHWQRTFLHPMLANFDAPMRDECLANRVYSNTPQQALTLLNDPTFAEAALTFAERVLHAPGNEVPSRLTAAFQLALGRAPREKEVTTLSAFYKTQLEHYTANPEDAKKLVSASLHKPDAALPTAELAAWTATCRVVLNLHETITRY
jgi:hypothetical protein